MLYLTEHFTALELTRSGSYPALASVFERLPALQAANLMRLAMLLEECRHFWGDRRIIVASAHRGTRLNERVGGSKTSRHLAGLAADVAIEELGALEAFRMLAPAHRSEAPAFDRCALYLAENRLHIDLNPDASQPPRRRLFVDSGEAWELVTANEALALAPEGMVRL
jgi:hypothetical protein